MASQILKGNRGIALWHLDAIAEHLKATVASLFEDDDAKLIRSALPEDAVEVGDAYRRASTHARTIVRLALHLDRDDTPPTAGNLSRAEVGEIVEVFTALTVAERRTALDFARAARLEAKRSSPPQASHQGKRRTAKRVADREG